MQVYFMKKENIPVPISTVILMIVTITYKMVLVLVGGVLAVFGRDFLSFHMGDLVWIFYLGMVTNTVLVLSLILLVFHPSLAKKILLLIFAALEKMHILKHKEGRLSKIENSMDLYQSTAVYMKNHMWLMLRVMLVTIVQRVALFLVTYLVYRGFGLHGFGWMKIVALQAVISISVDLLPLPGAMGVSETVFMLIFGPVFGELLLPGMILSRGISFYTQLIISSVFTLLTFILYTYQDRKNRSA